jgi:hypothetical protein
MNKVYVLLLHSDTLEPYESYPQTDLLRVYTSPPTVVQRYKVLKDMFAGSHTGMVLFALNGCEIRTSLDVFEDGDHYGSYYYWEVREVDYES